MFTDEISSSSWIFNSDASELFVVAVAFDFDTEASAGIAAVEEVDASVDMVWVMMIYFYFVSKSRVENCLIDAAFCGWFDVVILEPLFQHSHK